MRLVVPHHGPVRPQVMAIDPHTSVAGGAALQGVTTPMMHLDHQYRSPNTIDLRFATRWLDHRPADGTALPFAGTGMTHDRWSNSASLAVHQLVWWLVEAAHLRSLPFMEDVA
ncbi:hypothetical protein MMSR116_31525 [Methylobacterium mesophilicum SR1.6/6]|uniref:Uncharacterized protein n=1 Tax=Methylobacterium mesophilicum SR1.6/6 TaxID=908290 RepID=A0A6B9FTJ5_9HYPH|nr:hypothetical protein [Methylobacterium mesophilicum]QGY05920.1 hypothetical protein MMSR116_31525 [Methylobacterium mesophilicum SR1.6/6]